MGGVHDPDKMHFTVKTPLPDAVRFDSATTERMVGRAGIESAFRVAIAVRAAVAVVALFAFSAAAGDATPSKWRSSRTPAADAATPVAPAVTVSVECERGVLASDMPESAGVRVTLAGVPDEGGERVAVNAAFVLDASGAMKGWLFEKAREAVVDAVGRLDARDVVSVVSFGERARILVPAQAGGEAGTAAADALRAVAPGGEAAPFAGVAAGAAEVRKNLARGLENRLFVVSAGGAATNAGPDDAFALLGASLTKEGIVVSAVVAGSGGEDGAVAALARASGGDARFAADADALPGLVAEALEDAFRTVAREASVSVRFRDAFPVALEEAEGRIEDGVVSVRFGPVAAGREKSVLVRTEFPAGKDGETREFARAEAAWTRPGGGGSGNAAAVGSVKFSVDAAPAP